MRRLDERYGAWVVAARWPIVAASLILVAVAAAGALRLEFSTNYRVFFAEDNPELLALKAIENSYSKNDNVLLLIDPEDRDATSEQALAAAVWLTERAWQTPFSTRVDSIANFQHTTAHGDDLLVADLVDPEALGDAEARAAESAPSRSPIRGSPATSSPATAERARSTSPSSCRRRTRRSGSPRSPSS